MIRYLTLTEILYLHQQVVRQTGGAEGLRDLNTLMSALAQPQMTFDGVELYPTLAEKAAALGFSITMNHPFIDGNKRTGHAAMETFLVMNGFEITASIDEQETVMLFLASGELDRKTLTDWLKSHVQRVLDNFN
jgi:death-on-curing protein